MNDAFSRSMFLAPPTIAGVRLRAFSLYHAFVLEQTENPYVCGGRLPTVHDTALALAVCASSRRTGLGGLFRAFFSWWSIIAWHIRLAFSSKTRTAHRLQEHISAYFHVPEMYRKASCGGTPSTSKSGAPWQWNVATVVAGEVGIPWGDVWDMPICEVACIKAIVDERNGSGTIAWRLDKEYDKVKKATA